jgi:hypothetical protein
MTDKPRNPGETPGGWRSYSAQHRSAGMPRSKPHSVHTRHADERAQGVQSCARCRQLKPLDAFGIDKRNGRPRSWCKACQAEANREWKERNRAAYLEGKRRYRDAVLKRGGPPHEHA